MIDRQIKLGAQSVSILKYILHYQDRRGYPPSLLEICERLHYKSNYSAQYHMARMENAGIIKRTKGRARSIQIVDMELALRIANHGNSYPGNQPDNEEGRAA